MRDFLLGAGGCSEEESFHELFPLLGDGLAQHQVRVATPEKTHCGLLQTDPHACLLCPMNPYRDADPEAVEERAATHAWALGRAIKLKNMQASGVTFPYTDITAVDAALLQAGMEGAALTEERRREAQRSNPMDQDGNLSLADQRKAWEADRGRKID